MPWSRSCEMRCCVVVAVLLLLSFSAPVQPKQQQNGDVPITAAAAANTPFPSGIGAAADIMYRFTNMTEPTLLPCQRPRAWPSSNQGTSTSATKCLPGSNALQVTIQHKAVPGVTTKMMPWFWSNLNKAIADPRTGVVYPMWLLLHPVDNNLLSWSTPELVVVPSDPTKGTEWTMTYFIGTPLTAKGTAAKTGYTCATAQASLKRTPSMWHAYTYMKRLTPSSVILVSVYDSTEFSRTTLAFRDSPAGLLVNETIVSGLQEASIINAAINAIIIPRFYGAAVVGNLDKAVSLVVAHETELWASLAYWLPAAYKAYNK